MIATCDNKTIITANPGNTEISMIDMYMYMYELKLY